MAGFAVLFLYAVCIFLLFIKTTAFISLVILLGTRSVPTPDSRPSVETVPEGIGDTGEINRAPQGDDDTAD
ncbi:MAG: hypothetical protein ACI9K3_000978, partial [Halovenus sp.]